MNSMILVAVLLLLQQTGAADDQVSDQPGTAGAGLLLGSRRRFPAGNVLPLPPPGHDYDLTRLLDVGACIQVRDDNEVSYVPPLDGASPSNTLCQDDQYFMQFVLFDLQLVKLMAVDPVGGSFRAQLQLVLHWVDYLDDKGSNETKVDDCSFLCDSASPERLCCDGVWVPPLRMPGCAINQVQSSTPFPYLHYFVGETPLSLEECRRPNNSFLCYWNRLYYLNIDATCASQMDFHDFPFDVQRLTIDLLNPYASRTWFQLTKGFLQDNVGEGINGVKLSLDSMIPGWYVKNVTISNTCGLSQTWQQTFLAQDRLLVALQNQNSSMEGGYKSQAKDIIDALRNGKLVCASMEDIYNTALSPATDINLYLKARDKYEDRLSSTLEEYRICMQNDGKSFSWSVDIQKKSYIQIPNSSIYFSTSNGNIERSFSIPNLFKNQSTSNISFQCAMKAIANLTTPAIRVTILVQRYKTFYVVKLIFPTAACVAFAFTAFGLQPEELLGRLGVVVPSAIALTALQALVVATDVPPMAYIAPSTFIILISYLCQLSISCESILVKWMCTRKRITITWPTRGTPSSSLSRRNAPTMHSALSGFYYDGQSARHEETTRPRSATRIFDLCFMFVVFLLYALAILFCTVLRWLDAEKLKKKSEPGTISIWPNSSR